MTKRHRFYNAFANNQNRRQDRDPHYRIYPQGDETRTLCSEQDRFEPMRQNLNRALAFAGLAIEASGKLVSATAVQTLSEASKRARELREDLASRGVHPPTS